MDYLSLCLICKDENDYLPEWLDYHIAVGVDRFYIYDNESHVSLRESLQDYIARGWVVVVDIPGVARQLYAYDHCLQSFGKYTTWMGFIDTDEFLVPKNGIDLKELLKDYEQFGGLAVSSLFFGSNGHTVKPVFGQIASYTLRTHPSFHENILIKSIVQPSFTVMPYSPHDFIYKENYWCVNEQFLRVDNQDFPNHISKIQLNHYFCRSKREIEMKIKRGRGDTGNPWLQDRFDRVNGQSNFPDECILQNLNVLFGASNIDAMGLKQVSRSASLLEKIALLARSRNPSSLEINVPTDLLLRKEISVFLEFESQFREVKKQAGHEEILRWILKKLQLFPQRTVLYVDLAICQLKCGDSENAWQSLGQAWQIAPNSYVVLYGMAYYFLRVKNFVMAEKTCQLLLAMSPHDLTVLGFLTESMIEQGRWEEALKVGVPVVELAAEVGELPDQMGVYLVKKMADYLRDRQDYAGAVHLWEAGVKCQPGDVNALIEFSQALLRVGDRSGAQQSLALARSVDPQNEAVLALIKQQGFGVRPPAASRRRH